MTTINSKGITGTIKWGIVWTAIAAAATAAWNYTKSLDERLAKQEQASTEVKTDIAVLKATAIGTREDVRDIRTALLGRRSPDHEVSPTVAGAAPQ